ncbi:MAG: hypothetical protein QF918_05250 [Pirellulaceae bacterium]|jgi:hypothetical protein|nr:hypothetical protein [Pirellulaceae bacterium]MDP6556922.1 hypothetical protein [Pirellulaceae bacterium]MDP6721333.1 hypothetical protein [Pirellulaceae bacterium]
MTESSKLSPERVVQMAADLGGTPIPEPDSAAVADLLNSLNAEMSDMREMKIIESEPATTYQVSER